MSKKLCQKLQLRTPHKWLEKDEFAWPHRAGQNDRVFKRRVGVSLLKVRFGLGGLLMGWSAALGSACGGGIEGVGGGIPWNFTRSASISVRVFHLVGLNLRAEVAMRKKFLRTQLYWATCICPLFWRTRTLCLLGRDQYWREKLARVGWILKAN